VEHLELLLQTFQRPSDFKMQERPRGEQDSIIVRAIFHPVLARWVRESRSYYTIAEEESPEGLLVTLKVRQENEILQWLLSWGQHVQVLDPPSLRKKIAQEAEAMLHNHRP
jgi:predicted DNA-binding transcriptional regulator YafY